MSLVQEPQMNMSLTAEDNPLPVEKVNSAGLETKTELTSSLVSEEDLGRMRAQIATEFEHATRLSGKSGEWKAETGMGEQAAKVAWFGLKHPLLVGKGLFHVFKNRKERLREKNGNKRKINGAEGF